MAGKNAECSVAVPQKRNVMKKKRRNARAHSRAKMRTEEVVYSAKELSPETWADFAKVFSQGSGWNHCQCMHFHRPHALPKSERLRTRAERAVRNRKQKKELVEQGRAHGILVYAGGEPVGWCQFGPMEELPRTDNARKYRKAAPEAGSAKLWRIPCFAVLKEYRKRGAASFGLRAALEAIRKRGGGVVEGYPIERWLQRTFGNESTSGTASMFAKAGFRKVAPLGSTRFSAHVLMRRKV